MLVHVSTQHNSFPSSCHAFHNTHSVVQPPYRTFFIHSLSASKPLYLWPCIICACCSANLCPIRSLPAMNLETQRLTQPDSRAIRDLVVKSSMQASKQRSTRPENICVCCQCLVNGRYGWTSGGCGGVGDGGRVVTGLVGKKTKEGATYAHELLHLLALHALLKFTLLGGIESKSVLR